VIGLCGLWVWGWSGCCGGSCLGRRVYRILNGKGRVLVLVIVVVVVPKVPVLVRRGIVGGFVEVVDGDVGDVLVGVV